MLEERIEKLIHNLKDNEIEELFKNVQEYIVSDLVGNGLAEVWDESLHYYDIVDLTKLKGDGGG
jgi:hypothetical protein